MRSHAIACLALGRAAALSHVVARRQWAFDGIPLTRSGGQAEQTRRLAVVPQ